MNATLVIFFVLCAVFVIIVVGLIVVVVRSARGKIKPKPRWEALAALLTESRTSQNRVDGSYEGRPVTATLAKKQMLGAGNMPLSDSYLYSLEMTVAAPGQGLAWRVTGTGGAGLVETDDPAFRDGAGGAELVTATAAWQARFPALPSDTIYDANSGRLFYQQANAINPYLQDMRDSEGASYIPSPPQFGAQLELLSTLAVINARCNPPATAG